MTRHAAAFGSSFANLLIAVRLLADSLLSPSPDAAVVGGNVLTSQRVTDVVLKAFNAAAASQARRCCGAFGEPGKLHQLVPCPADTVAQSASLCF